jgi:hypothetical protein
MKKLGIIVLLALAMLLANCGSRTVSQQNLTGTGGNWEAEFTGGTGNAALLAFTTQFNTGFGGGPFNIYFLSFINTNPCFATVTKTSGSATLVTNGADVVTGSLSYTVIGSSASSAGSSPYTSTLTLTANPNLDEGELTGTASGSSGNTALEDGVAYGDWTLTSSNSACTGAGTFIMCQESATCTITTGSN